MPAGFITDGFVSAFNPTRTTLVINNVDTGVPVDGYSIIPNDSYIIQETGFGTIKTVWSHLSLSGDVTLYLKDIPEGTANFIDKLCLKQDTNYYVSFLGYMYRTEQVDITIQPTENSVNRLDVTLTFYGKLPYSTPIFRPGFSTNYSNEISRISSITASQSLLMPLPGNSLKNREDTILALVKNTTNYATAKVVSSIKDYTSRNLTFTTPLTSNYASASDACIGLLNISDGLDDIVIATLASDVITLRFMQVKDNNLNESSRAQETLPESGATRISVIDGKLYVYFDARGSYKLVSYNIMEKDLGKSRTVLEDSSKMRSLASIPAEGQQAPLAPPTTINSSNYVLEDNRSKLLIVDTLSDVTNAYDSFILPKATLNQIGGVDTSTFTVERIKKVDDSKLIIFFRNLRAGNSYVHYVTVNFRDIDNERGNKKTPFITSYRVTNVNPGSFRQVLIYAGITQTNTAVLADNKCYMSTEAYTDFYIENNVLAVTQTSMGFKFFLHQVGNDVVIKCMSK